MTGSPYGESDPRAAEDTIRGIVDPEPPHGGRLLVAPSLAADSVRGIIASLPITGAGPFVGPAAIATQSLKLDAGTWLLRACRLRPGTDEAAAAPAAANSLFPVALIMSQGVGGALLRQTDAATPIPARGLCIIKECDSLVVQVGAAASNLVAERVWLGAVKCLQRPVLTYQEATAVVAAAGTGTFNIPTGAVKVSIQGLAAVPIVFSWIDAAGAGKAGGTVLGSQAGQQVPIPTTAAQLAVGPIAAGATVTVVWELSW